MTRTALGHQHWLERVGELMRIVDASGYEVTRWRQLAGDPAPAARRVVRSRLELRGEAPSRGVGAAWRGRDGAYEDGKAQKLARGKKVS